jgi:hypothetical protein
MDLSILHMLLAGRVNLLALSSRFLICIVVVFEVLFFKYKSSMLTANPVAFAINGSRVIKVK